MMTESIDRTKDVLDELEAKILLKYSKELEEIDAGDQQVFKLKAGQNKQLSRVFQETLG